MSSKPALVYKASSKKDAKLHRETLSRKNKKIKIPESIGVSFFKDIPKVHMGKRELPRLDFTAVHRIGQLCFKWMMTLLLERTEKKLQRLQF